MEFDFNNAAYQVKAKREVILSAGTTNTAQLLMLSGIGPLSELKKFDVSCSFFYFLCHKNIIVHPPNKLNTTQMILNSALNFN